VRHEGARCEWIALVGGAADAGNVISGQCLEACPHLGMRRWQRRGVEPKGKPKSPRASREATGERKIGRANRVNLR
jgi:hypothetical protein